VRKTLLVLALLGALGVAAAPATADAIHHFPQKATEGFYRGQAVEYLDFGPVKLRPGNSVAPIWSVTNGVQGQANIVDVVPGQRGYTPLWSLTLVRWKSGMTPRLLTSAAAVRRAVVAGEVTIKKTATVVNCPLI
jgi:hypothetical protein